MTPETRESLCRMLDLWIRRAEARGLTVEAVGLAIYKDVWREQSWVSPREIEMNPKKEEELVKAKLDLLEYVLEDFDG